MTLEITLGFEDEPTSGVGLLPLIYGGLRIEIDGAELMRYHNQETLSEEVKQRDQYNMEWHDASGDILSVEPYHFKGEYLSVDLGNLTDAFLECVRTPQEEYKEIPAELKKIESEIVLSYLDSERLRIAFQDRMTGPDERKRYPTDRVACGYPVNVDNFRTELIDCYETLLEYVNTGVGSRSDHAVENTCAELKRRLESLREVQGSNL